MRRPSKTYIRNYTPQSLITRLRSARTRQLRHVTYGIDHLLTGAIEWNLRGERVPPDSRELPSWYPFWSDMLYDNVRRLVRVARELDKEEARVHGYDPQLTAPK